MLYPLTFRPLFKERIWGGRNIERLFGKQLPPQLPIGESWEICDRPDDVSVIANGPLADRDLRWLIENHSQELLGAAKALNGRFPLLVKILDAQEKLSLQVHPPADLAKKLGGEPKTEMWLIVQAEPHAELFVGLKRGVTRAEFERRLREGSVQDCFHRLAVQPGDAMFLPSGRVHAIGGGNVIFEIQQNSDPTYRVFDWNRVDAKGKPRELHVAESLASIDFNDFEPPVLRADGAEHGRAERILVQDALFQVSERRFAAGSSVHRTSGRPVILGIISGSLVVKYATSTVELRSGAFCLVPACVEQFTLECAAPVELLWTVPG